MTQPAPTRPSGHRDRCASACLGCGNVGGALAELLLIHGDDIDARTGISLELAGIAVADPTRAAVGRSSRPI